MNTPLNQQTNSNYLPSINRINKRARINGSSNDDFIGLINTRQNLSEIFDNISVSNNLEISTPFCARSNIYPENLENLENLENPGAPLKSFKISIEEQTLNNVARRLNFD